MSPNPKYSAKLEIEVEEANPPLEIADEYVLEFTRRLALMHRVTPIDKITFERLDPLDRLLWKYTVKSYDGRKSVMMIRFEHASPLATEDDDPLVTLDIRDEWRESELSYNRTIRLELIKLRNRRPDIVSVTAKYGVTP